MFDDMRAHRSCVRSVPRKVLAPLCIAQLARSVGAGIVGDQLPPQYPVVNVHVPERKLNVLSALVLLRSVRLFCKSVQLRSAP